MEAEAPNPSSPPPALCACLAGPCLPCRHTCTAYVCIYVCTYAQHVFEYRCEACVLPLGTRLPLPPAY
jgi:hypothetical protein